MEMRTDLPDLTIPEKLESHDCLAEYAATGENSLVLIWYIFTDAYRLIFIAYGVHPVKDLGGTRGTCVSP